jgi:hypothetical protein
MAKHTRRVRLRDCGSLESAGDCMSKTVEAEAVTLQAERLELIAEKLTQAGANLAALAGTPGKARE